jgi:DNA invertase Pin-like site-specific DNA recombinase
MKIGYIRASARDDFYETQLEALTNMQCGRVFEDIGSSFSALEHMLDYLREDDTVCVYQLDRFGLTVKHLMKFTYDLMGRNISLCSAKDHIDTASAEGELLFKIFNVLSLCEQNAIPLREDLRTESRAEMRPEMRLEPRPEIRPESSQHIPVSIKKVEGHDLYTNIHTMPMKEASFSSESQTVQQLRQTAMPNASGRPRGLTSEAKQKAEAAAALYQEGALSMREIAGNLNISTATLYSYLRHEKVI